MTLPAEALSVYDLLDQSQWSVDTAAGEDEFRELVKDLPFFTLQELADTLKAHDRQIAVIPLYALWIELNTGVSPHLFAVWFNIAVEAGNTGDHTNAIIAYHNALTLNGGLYQAAVNLGLQYEQIGQEEKALEIWSQYLQPDEARTALLNHQGRLQENLKQYEEAEAKLFASLLTNPYQPEVVHHWVYLRQKMCAWPFYGPGIPGLTVQELARCMGPLSILAIFDDIGFQNGFVRTWLEKKALPTVEPLCPPGGYAHDRIRLGYMSSDYMAHPVSYLVAELFERHDRSQFEVYGYCSSNDDGSFTRQRVISAFDKLIPIREMSDEQVARTIREDEIDILIDLNGLTLGTRLFALNWRPAPVQVTWLGYIGPIPFHGLDYMICDDFVIPKDVAGEYQPAPLYLPQNFQVNDTRLPVGPTPTRAEAGLPDDRFVFCCFSNNYKITEEVFEAWITILNRTEDTALWLLADNPWAHRNMVARAVARGIDPGRLIFTERVSPADYLGRLALADLFLDTHPYNAGTTASDALRMGLPVLTWSGKTFASRMAGSLLRTIGLDWGIAASLDEYVEKAVELASDPAKYREVRAAVSGDAWRRTVGNIELFIPRLEAAYRSIVKRG